MAIQFFFPKTTERKKKKREKRESVRAVDSQRHASPQSEVTVVAVQDFVSVSFDSLSTRWGGGGGTYKRNGKGIQNNKYTDI